VNGMKIQMLRFADDIRIIVQDEINLKRTIERVDDILKSSYKIKINKKKMVGCVGPRPLVFT
jgi:CRISPR/Cas system CMR-associated protein Cmr3 (group 5 of RAMP superfamily)